MNSKRNAIIISVIIILLLIFSLVFILLMNKSGSNPKYAYIYKDGILVRTIDFSQVTEEYTFTITGDNGEYNEIRVTKDSIGVTDASCPDKLCQHMGLISTSVMPVTCLPNHLVIELSDNLKEGSEIDGIAY